MNGPKDGNDHVLNQRIQDEITDNLDEELELDLDDSRLDQDWVQHQKLKVVVIFEAGDSAGRGGGVTKRVTQRLNPRVCRVAALPAPNERERTQ